MGVDDGDEDRECGRCHETMHIPPGAEPSEFCHDCAHSLVDELRARVAELEERLDAMMPLFEEARDALPAISLGTAKLRGIRLDLADRMDDVGDPGRWAARKSASAASADIDAARAAEAKK